MTYDDDATSVLTATPPATDDPDRDLSEGPGGPDGGAAEGGRRRRPSFRVPQLGSRLAAAVAGAVAALREARPELVHDEGGNTWLGHRIHDRDDATAAEIAAAVSAIADGVPAEVLWHPDLLALAVCRIETDL